VHATGEPTNRRGTLNGGDERPRESGAGSIIELRD
jgi:hypothetical protein